MNIKKCTYVKPFLDKAFIPKSRPSHYPTPDIDELVFFIQRNHNTDTVVYKINRNLDGLINMDEPLQVFWIKYKEEMIIKELNFLQKKLAYGYKSQMITPELFEIEVVSYPKRMFLVKKNDGEFHLVTDLNNEKSILDHVYIYAEENGVFPDVKFIELFGYKLDSTNPIYEKIEIS